LQLSNLKKEEEAVVKSTLKAEVSTTVSCPYYYIDGALLESMHAFWCYASRDLD
jgi:hypothetical protein